MSLYWKDSLSQKMNLVRTGESNPPRICVIGVGNDLRGDDSAGLIVVRRLLADERLKAITNLLILEGGPAPENQTGALRIFQPDLVLFVDAAHFDAPAGTLQLIPIETIDGMSASSHSLPLSMLAKYITFEFGCQVNVLGIQPAQNEVGTNLSPSVCKTVGEIVEHLASTSKFQ